MMALKDRSSGDMAEVRRGLLDRKAELTHRREALHADRRHEADPLSADAPDRAVQQENDAVVDTLESAATSEIDEINKALRRLDEGSYGICETCAGPIGARRLTVVPYAVQCQSCAAQANS